jgi:hypothetical protein
MDDGVLGGDFSRHSECEFDAAGSVLLPRIGHRLATDDAVTVRRV